MRKILIAGILVAFSIPAWTQHEAPSLYWVVETNVIERNYTIIRLYNRNHELVHELKWDGIHIDTRKSKHRKKVNKVLKDYSHSLSSTVTSKKGK